MTGLSVHVDLAQRDRLIPGLRVLFDPGHLSQAIETVSGVRFARLSPVYVRYKAGTSCLVAYRTQGPMGTSFLYAKAFPESAPAKFRKMAVSPCVATWLGAGPVLLPHHGVIALAFPNDARLRFLRRIAEPSGREQLLRRAPESLRQGDIEFRTLAYRPERRYVAERCRAAGEAPGAVMKMYTREGYEQAAAQTRVAASRDILRVPRRLARDSRRHLLFLEWLPGRVAAGLLGSLEPIDAQASLIGQALAELHAQPVSASTPRSSSYERDGISRVLDNVARVFPRLCAPVERLRERIDGALAERQEPAIVHGDFHLRQVLVSSGGIAFVDFDRAGAGPAAGDIACCLAHLERDVLAGELDAQRAGDVAHHLLAGYARVAAPPAPRVLRAFTAAALARLLPEPFRRCRADAFDLTARMLDRAHQFAASAESTVVAL